MLRLTAPLRVSDRHGQGHYGAPRGNRLHLGADYAAWPASKVYPIVGGTVTKVGYPYGDDLKWRYVRIEDINGWTWRYFYVEPKVKKGDEVTVGDCIGLVQDLRARYDGITPHVHVDVRDAGGDWLDPEKL